MHTLLAACTIVRNKDPPPPSKPSDMFYYIKRVASSLSKDLAGLMFYRQIYVQEKKKREQASCSHFDIATFQK